MTNKRTDQEYKSRTEGGKGPLIDKQVHGETSHFNKRKYTQITQTLFSLNYFLSREIGTMLQQIF